MCILQLLFEPFLILKKNRRDIVINMIIYINVKYPLFLSGFSENWISSTDFRKKKLKY
jgi:hypothetical protein